jgi:NTP pyrophosphatase (non-canonical NTP hydrolase)
MTEFSTPLPVLARRISAEIDARFPIADRQVRQMLALCEEAGELAEAYAAWRDAVDAYEDPEDTEPLWREVCAELADVTLVTHVAAAVLDMPLPSTVEPATDPWADARWLRSEEGHVLAVCASAVGTAAAWRRWAGMARRRGTRMDVAARLADVHDWVCRTAEVLGVDLPDAVNGKAAVVLTRGWRDPARCLPSGEPCAYAHIAGTDGWHEHDHLLCQDAVIEAIAAGVTR